MRVIDADKLDAYLTDTIDGALEAWRLSRLSYYREIAADLSHIREHIRDMVVEVPCQPRPLYDEPSQTLDNSSVEDGEPHSDTV
jgi:hypothetical protein